MTKGRFGWFFLATIICLVTGCTITPATPMDTQNFSFSAPAGWSIHEGPSATGKTAGNYMALDLKILYVLSGQEYVPFVTITSRDLPPGSSLEQEFNATYAAISTKTRGDQTTQMTVDGLTAQVRRYDRPWGEPWYSFQDTWVEKGGQIYMIACQTRLNSTSNDLAGCKTILASLHFK